MTAYSELDNTDLNREIARRLGWTSVRIANSISMPDATMIPAIPLVGNAPYGEHRLWVIPAYLADTALAVSLLENLHLDVTPRMTRILAPKNWGAVTLWRVTLSTGYNGSWQAEDKSLPRAICIALLEMSDEFPEAIGGRE